jgi:hypothetical protein
MGPVEFDTYLVEFREKPVFIPGYYRQTRNGSDSAGQGYCQFWSYEPDLEFWERVDVTKVD